MRVCEKKKHTLRKFSYFFYQKLKNLETSKHKNNFWPLLNSITRSDKKSLNVEAETIRVRKEY